MKNNDNEKPQGMKIRQSIQDAMTYSLPEKEFSEKKIDLVELDIRLENLGQNFDGYAILNLTDIHLGQWISPHYLYELMDFVNTLDFDLLTLTGKLEFWEITTIGWMQRQYDKYLNHLALLI